MLEKVLFHNDILPDKAKYQNLSYEFLLIKSCILSVIMIELYAYMNK